MNIDTLKHAWMTRQNELADEEVDQMIDSIVSKSSAFDSGLVRRDKQDYIGASVALAYGLLGVFAPRPMIRVGSWVIVISVVVTIIALFIYGRTRPVPTDFTFRDYCVQQLRRVENQIFFVRNLAWVFLVPIAVGVLITQYGITRSMTVSIVFGAVLVVLIGFIHFVNRRGARLVYVPYRDELANALSHLHEVPSLELVSTSILDPSEEK